MLQENQPAVDKKLAQMRRDAEERDAGRRAERLGVPYLNLSKAPVSLEAVKLLSEAEARAAQAATVEIKGHEVALALFDSRLPAAQAVVQRLEAERLQVKQFITSLSGLEQAWYFYKFIHESAKGITGKVDIEQNHFEGLLAKLTNLESIRAEIERAGVEKINTTNLFEIILAGALKTGASDVHFEAEERSARVRFRLDGILHDVFMALPHKSYESLITRIKLLSGLKMNVHGEPQDGRFTIKLPAKEIEMRVSIIPSEFGETIVMRVLDPDAIHVSMSDLGMREDDLALVERELANPNGLILNTGPTGSGKTTTLYAFLQKLVSPEVKIITVEDPIEYRVAGIEQTQVNPEVGYTFANGLRAILRQDPDTILVGEIRDHETADIALQAALTGHIVLSTLHTNNAIGAVPRLVDLEIKPSTIGAALSLVIAQRLVRKLCPHCRKEASVTEDMRANAEKFLARMPARVKPDTYRDLRIYEPGGCDVCNHIGYKGRIGIFEFLTAGPELEERIMKDPSEISLRELAKKEEMVEMQEDGVLKVLRGETSLEEVVDVTGPIVWGEKVGSL